MKVMLKIINTLYYQYYLFFKNIIKEEDIPSLNAILFVCILETFTLSLLVNAFLVILFCEPIPRILYFGIFILVLLSNYFYYYYYGAKNEVLCCRTPVYSGLIARALAFLTPFLVWGLAISTAIYSHEVLTDCGYEGMFNGD